MAGILADEDFSLRVVEELRRLGHDVVTVRPLGLANRGVDDSSVLEAATQSVRAVVTYNRRHFGRLHLSDANHAGIIVCTRDPNVVRQAQRIYAAISLENALSTARNLRNGHFHRSWCPEGAWLPQDDIRGQSFLSDLPATHRRFLGEPQQKHST
jgi:hypothetical protein